MLFEALSHPRLREAKLAGFSLCVQGIQRVLVTFLLERIFDSAELLAELAVQYLDATSVHCRLRSFSLAWLWRMLWRWVRNGVPSSSRAPLSWPY